MREEITLVGKWKEGTWSLSVKRLICCTTRCTFSESGMYSLTHSRSGMYSFHDSYVLKRKQERLVSANTAPSPLWLSQGPGELHNKQCTTTPGRHDSKPHGLKREAHFSLSCKVGRFVDLLKGNTWAAGDTAFWRRPHVSERQLELLAEEARPKSPEILKLPGEHFLIELEGG